MVKRILGESLIGGKHGSESSKHQTTLHASMGINAEGDVLGAE
jgi:hypothetical protein